MEASRIASVSAAVLVGFPASGRVDPTSARCDAIALATRMVPIFEETLWVGDPPPAGLRVRHVACREDRRDPVAGLATAIEAARGDRVIVVGEGDPTVSAELLLAFVAWPESPIVMISDGVGGEPLPAIYRRDLLVDRARAALARVDSFATRERFLAGVEIAVVPRDRLGLGGSPSALFEVVVPEDSSVPEENVPDDGSRRRG